MLTEIDRIQIATPDAAAAAEAWHRLLGAEPESNDPVHALGAKRTTLRLGSGCIEFLEPDGAGVIADALRKRGRGHLFAAGIATPSFEGVVARLRARKIELAVESGQAFFNAAPVLGVDCPLVLSPHESRPSVGALDFLYEVTLLAGEAKQISSRLADLFVIEEKNFVPISSERFGYDGVLTLFKADDLHRFEIITPTDETKTMGRYFARNGVSYYMCFAETADIRDIEARAAELGASVTVDRPDGRDEALPADQMWVHPPALGGVMLGLSRPSMAWKWSGHPERVQEIA
jgi:hypothetical protein